MLWKTLFDLKLYLGLILLYLKLNHMTLLFCVASYIHFISSDRVNNQHMSRPVNPQ